MMLSSSESLLEESLLSVDVYEDVENRGGSRTWGLRTRVRNSPPPVEITFQIMMHRKLMRKIWGTYESDKPWTMMWVFLTLLLVLGVAGASFQNGDISIKFNTGQIGFWSMVTVVTFSILVYTLTKVIVVIRWMLYWLLLAEVLNLLINKDYNLFGPKTSLGLLISLAVAEFFTFTIYIFVNFLYPRILASAWFRRRIGAREWWQVRSIGPWTLTYAGGVSKGHRSTCTYRGQTNEAGLPHGYGHWMDDSYHGEILTGWWEAGRPVGPFRSREFGSGYAFDNVMIGYVIATDDDPSSFRYFPSNSRPPRCGVASVECSVSGGFFAHLPLPKFTYGPKLLRTKNPMGTHDTVTKNLDNASIADCLDQIRHLSYAHPLTNLVITANPERGITVAGHIYKQTGKASSKECKHLVIDVVYPSVQSPSPILTDEQNMTTPNFRSSLKLAENDTVTKDDDDELCLHDEENDTYFIESDHADHDSFNFRALNIRENRSMDSFPSNASSSTKEDAQKLLLQTNASSNSLTCPIPNGFDQMNGHFQPVDANSNSTMHLKVRDWRSTVDGHVEALIFIPGFNASLEHSLERLGQFLVMGHFPPHIKPFIFNWPAGRIATYLWAVESAAFESCVKVFEQMMDGLREAGIRDVHFLCHSMGVQCLMAAFADKIDKSRSDFSCRFMLAPDFAEENSSSDDSDTGHDENLLRVRTITLLNPDYPLAAFLQKGFPTIRRICNHITIVGNREDVALFWSEMGNGFMNSWYTYVTGHNNYPPHLRTDSDREFSGPKDPDSCCPDCVTCCMSNPTYEEHKNQGLDRLLSKQLTVGKQIFSLFAPPEQRRENVNENSFFVRAPQAILSRMRGDHFKRKNRRIVPRRPWLDLDAIDTTWMETNVHALRHSYFNLNPVLVEDLAELIVTGRRASERATLLHREGNIYSYCQAPACVVNEG